jgi:uridine kinase
VLKPIVCVGIAGGSCSGKTRIVQQLIDDLKGKLRCFHISMDSYYYDRSSVPPDKRMLINYDIPDAFDHLLLVNHVSKILNNEKVSIPVYNFMKHTRNGSKQTTVMDLLIVEGIYALYFEELRKFYCIKIFIEVSEKIRTERRLHRDTVERGREENEVMKQMEDIVLPMHDVWVEKTRVFADKIINSGTNDIGSCSKLIIKGLCNKYPDVL